MVQLKKKSFLRSSEPALASYDWVDVASRVGYIQFDAFTDSSGSYHLSADAAYSKDVSLVTGNLQGSSADFGTFETGTFNYPSIMNGKVLIIFSFDMAAGAGTGNCVSKVRAVLYHNTDVLTTLDSHTITNSGVTDPETVVLSYNITNRNLKIGDQLKLKLTGYETGGSRACTVRIGIDPTNSGDTNIDTSTDKCSTARCILAVPFKLDL